MYTQFTDFRMTNQPYRQITINYCSWPWFHYATDIQIIFLTWTRDGIYIKRHITVELENSWRAHKYNSIGIHIS